MPYDVNSVCCAKKCKGISKPQIIRGITTKWDSSKQQNLGKLRISIGMYDEILLRLKENKYSTIKFWKKFGIIAAIGSCWEHTCALGSMGRSADGTPVPLVIQPKRVHGDEPGRSIAHSRRMLHREVWLCGVFGGNHWLFGSSWWEGQHSDSDR